jgi:hypothetical protein
VCARSAPYRLLGYVEPDMESVHGATARLTLYFNLFIRQVARLAGGFGHLW